MSIIMYDDDDDDVWYSPKIVQTSSKWDKDGEWPSAGAGSWCVIKKFKQNFLLYCNVVAFRDTASRPLLFVPWPTPNKLFLTLCRRPKDWIAKSKVIISNLSIADRISTKLLVVIRTIFKDIGCSDRLPVVILL